MSALKHFQSYVLSISFSSLSLAPPVSPSRGLLPCEVALDLENSQSIVGVIRLCYRGKQKIFNSCQRFAKDLQQNEEKVKIMGTCGRAL